jgi:hypothetical protein
MSYMLRHKSTNKTELEYLKSEFIRLEIYSEFKKQFYNKSRNVLWIVLGTVDSTSADEFKNFN